MSSPRSLLILAALAGALSLAGCKGSDDTNQKTEAAGPALPQVDVVLAQPVSEPVEITLYGTVTTPVETNVAATGSGTLVSLSKNIGDTVSAGETVAIIEQTSSGGSPSSASMGELSRARAEVDKLAPLYARGFVTKKRFEAARARLNAAEAGSSIAAPTRSRSEVTAPLDGTVTARSATTGQFVNAGSNLLTVAAGTGPAGIELVTTSVEPFAARIPVGADAKVDFSGTEISGSVASIEYDELTGSSKIGITLSGAKDIEPGALGKAIVSIAPGEIELFRIPTEALANFADGEGVVLVVGEGGILEMRKVRLQKEDKQTALVSGMLAKGDRVVARADGSLRAGKQVRARTVSMKPKANAN